jgi:hypothetical protein
VPALKGCKRRITAVVEHAGPPFFRGHEELRHFLPGFAHTGWEVTMHGIIYLIGLIVVIVAILSFFGLR